MSLTPEEEVKLLRDAIHNTLTCLEKDKGIYDKSRTELIKAYVILEKAFMATAHSTSVLMGIDRDRRDDKIKAEIGIAAENDLYDISEHLTSEIDYGDDT